MTTTMTMTTSQEKGTALLKAFDAQGVTLPTEERKMLLEECEALDFDDLVTTEGDFMILTDDEADEKWNESLENYIDECILPEIPEFARQYFDSEKWMDDARHDGRGHSLSTYDGDEYEIQVNSTWYYIYRTN